MNHFLKGFLCGVSIFIFMNVVAYTQESSPIRQENRIMRYGFPMIVWTEGGLPRVEEYNVTALLIDGLVGVSFGAVGGWLFWKLFRGSDT